MARNKDKAIEVSFHWDTKKVASPPPFINKLVHISVWGGEKQQLIAEHRKSVKEHDNGRVVFTVDHPTANSVSIRLETDIMQMFVYHV